MARSTPTRAAFPRTTTRVVCSTDFTIGVRLTSLREMSAPRFANMGLRLMTSNTTHPGASTPLPEGGKFLRFPDMRLRKAVPEDALCLSVLAMQVFLDTYATEGIRPEIAREVLSSYSQAVFAKAISAEESRITVAERNGHLIGFAQVTFSANHSLAPAGAQAELLRLYVQESFTGAKVGTALLAEAESIACLGGATVLWLTPWVHNQRALAFYSRRGYTDFGLTYFTFEGESHENRVLAKSLAVPNAA